VLLLSRRSSLRCIIVDQARDNGFKVLVAMAWDRCAGFSGEFRPTRYRSTSSSDMLGWTVLTSSSRIANTGTSRVQVVSLDEDRRMAWPWCVLVFTNTTTAEGVERPVPDQNTPPGAQALLLWKTTRRTREHH